VPGVHEVHVDPRARSTPSSRLVDAERLLGQLPAPTQPTDTPSTCQHCVNACQGGVERSHILPFAVDGALLMEIFTHDGIGTMVVDEKLESLREATSDDVGGILQLIEPSSATARSSRGAAPKSNATSRRIRSSSTTASFSPVPRSMFSRRPTRRDGRAHGIPAGAGQGDGERILKRIEQRARALGLGSIFVLTTRTMHWFIKRGFEHVEADWLPEARKRNTTGTGAHRYS
jgi:amino-acid N-acetyltransferase